MKTAIFIICMVMFITLTITAMVINSIYGYMPYKMSVLAISAGLVTVYITFRQNKLK